MRHARNASLLLTLLFLGLVFFDAVRDHSPVAQALLAEKGAGLEDFMLVVHGPQGLKTQIKEALKGSGPADDKAWKTVRARAAVVTFLTESILLKAAPEKGDKASWKTKVNDYYKLTRAITGAAGEKDLSRANTELKKLEKSCDACHKAHKE